jgi:hypothetical protein
MPNVIGPSFIVTGIAPPDVTRAPMERRRPFWGAVVNFVIEAKERELRKGLDRFGNPMHALAQSTIKRRKSAVGPAHAYAPPLTPAYQRSRTRSLFTAEVNDRATGVICWWMYDEITGASWGEILEHHRTGSARLPVRDVIGLAPGSLARVKQQAAVWWTANLPALPAVPPEYVMWTSPATGRTYRIKVTPGGPRPTGVEPRVVTPLPPSRGQAPLPSETGIPRTQPARYTQVQTFRLGRHTYTLQGGLGVAPPKPPPAFGAAVPAPKPPRPKPVPKPAAKPVLPAVGDAINIKDVPPKLERTARTVWNAIDKVHGDGKLPVISFKEESSSSYLGSLSVNSYGTPIRMQARPDGPHVHMTIAHETGHFLDYGGIPRTKLQLKEERDWRGEDLFKEFFRAIDASDSIRTLRDRQNEEIVKRTMFGATVDTPVDQAYVSYLLQDNEIWARSYAQWIAFRSKEDSLLADYSHVLSRDIHATYPAQWQITDFDVIAEAIDGIFRTLGWLK